jgi:hypothetical protein
MTRSRDREKEHGFRVQPAWREDGRGGGGGGRGAHGGGDKHVARAAELEGLVLGGIAAGRLAGLDVRPLGHEPQRDGAAAALVRRRERARA